MNWSLMLNAFLLFSVVAVLIRMLRRRTGKDTMLDELTPALSKPPSMGDDIIAVRKVEMEAAVHEPARPVVTPSPSALSGGSPNLPRQQTLMIFLLAKPQRQLAGYEMLQTLLAAGLRFGEGQLFHYHQNNHGQGPVLCSLADATAGGTFDLQNMGAFNTKGLCLFMYLSGSPHLDVERLDKMVDIANQLAEGLDTFLLDDQRQPFTEETQTRYRQQISLPH